MKALTLSYPLHAALSMTLFAAVEVLTGCGAAAPCTYTSAVTISPAVGAADHLAVAPGDQQQFSALSQREPTTASAGCAVPTANPTNVTKLTPAWTVSDSTNVKISSAQDATNGLATCIGTTKSTVTVTALGALTAGGATKALGTATLTCK
ncbi:hypothetical protein HDF16_000895 [Granulicella aggregans]|uniref:Ig-like domain-containing protein n=1 Tax=Granulicella aggregans TaxID=474949 RepID=A0A7W7ZAA3_9BACT|nr:hypothetical protein [Granulicella aggregans]MBB5056226.1 hypothetical protein [Granulicella aggregans]